MAQKFAVPGVQANVPQHFPGVFYFRQTHTEIVEEALLLRTRRHYQYRARQNPDDRPFAHPCYWAAFTLYGDGDWGPD